MVEKSADEPLLCEEALLAEEAEDHRDPSEELLDDEADVALVPARSNTDCLGLADPNRRSDS